MATNGTDGRLMWEPGEKASALEGWVLNVLSDNRLSCGALRIATLLSLRFNSQNGACWLRKTKMAAAVKVSVSSIKQGLGELEKAGHILRVQEVIRDKSMRVIYPVLNGDIEDQTPRARRGGVPTGVNPRERAAENAARKTVGGLEDESAASAPATARPTLRTAPEPALDPEKATTSAAPVHPSASSDALDRGSPIDPDPTTPPSVKSNDYPAGGLPYWRVNITLDHQGFRSKPRRLTADQTRELSQAWADGEFDIVAERLTGERPIHQSSLRTEDQSGNGSKAVPPSIQEQSINIIPDPIPGRRIQPEQVVVGCSHTGCRVPARFRSLSNGDLLCIRHRGGGVSCVEL